MTTPQKKSRKKTLLIIGGVAVVALWLIGAHLFGPNSDRGIAQRVEKLQADSVALQGDFRPKASYSHYRDVSDAVQEIRDLGNPLRYDSTDSVRMFSNPRTASLAKYNIAKCDSVLSDVLPLWRNTFALAFNKQFVGQSVAKFDEERKDTPENTTLYIYSLRYLSQDEISSDAMKFNGALQRLGFKKAIYAASPENAGIEYSFN